MWNHPRPACLVPYSPLRRRKQSAPLRSTGCCPLSGLSAVGGWVDTRHQLEKEQSFSDGKRNFFQRSSREAPERRKKALRSFGERVARRGFFLLGSSARCQGFVNSRALSGRRWRLAPQLDARARRSSAVRRSGCSPRRAARFVLHAGRARVRPRAREGVAGGCPLSRSRR